MTKELVCSLGCCSWWGNRSDDSLQGAPRCRAFSWASLAKSDRMTRTIEGGANSLPPTRERRRLLTQHHYPVPRPGRLRWLVGWLFKRGSCLWCGHETLVPEDNPGI